MTANFPLASLNWRAYVAEFLGTFVFIFVSLGAALADLLFGDIGPLGIVTAAGFSYVAMVFATVSVSGGHLNPAISLALWFVGKIGAIDLIFYSLAQFLAGFAAVLSLLYIFSANFGDFTPGALLGQGVTLQQIVVAEAIFGAILIFVYFATMVDKQSLWSSPTESVAGLRRGPTSFGPIALGLVVMCAILVAAPVSGGIINPAKALAPAVISNSYSELLAWIIGPYVGSLFGLVYEFLFLRKKK